MTLIDSSINAAFDRYISKEFLTDDKISPKKDAQAAMNDLTDWFVGIIRKNGGAGNQFELPGCVVGTKEEVVALRVNFFQRHCLLVKSHPRDYQKLISTSNDYGRTNEYKVDVRHRCDAHGKVEISKVLRWPGQTDEPICWQLTFNWYKTDGSSLPSFWMIPPGTVMSEIEAFLTDSSRDDDAMSKSLAFWGPWLQAQIHDAASEMDRCLTKKERLNCWIQAAPDELHLFCKYLGMMFKIHVVSKGIFDDLAQPPEEPYPLSAKMGRISKKQPSFYSLEFYRDRAYHFSPLMLELPS